MAYKYKLTEMSKKASAEDAEKELGIPKSKFEVGQVTVSDNGNSKSTITNIDNETGAISWKITQLPGFDKLFDDMDELVATAKRVYVKTKDDDKFREIYEDVRKVRNKLRTHLRNEYPDEYKRIVRISENDVDEISMSGAAGAYLTPYAFRKKGSKPDDEAYKELGYKVVKEKALPVVRKKLAKVPKAKKVASKYKMKLPSGVVSTLGYTVSEDATKSANIHKQGQHPGEDLGPGPKAGDEGVTDSAYTKQFKYKLVPKNKDGTYVQKGSGMIVKNLF